MPLEIRQLPAMRLAYMRQTDPYGPGDQGVILRNDQTGFVIHI